MTSFVNAFQIKERQFTLDVLELTSKLLGKNPEYYTIWNYRRRILSHQLTESFAADEAGDVKPATNQTNLQLISNDLDFLIPLLKEFPKCYWLWNYRLWLLEQAEVFLKDNQVAELWEKELVLVTMMLSKDGRNFHGWGYRRRIVAQIERLSGITMVETEFAYTTKMIRVALHNFSALHYRSKLIPRLLDERKADGHHRRQMLDDELELMQNALIDPTNQSPWFYHQFLMSTIAPGIRRESAIVLDLTNSERITYYEREIERIEEILEIDDDSKLVYEALLRYSIELNLLDNQTLQMSASKLRLWLSKLRQLDCFRAGRWDDLQCELQL